MNASNYPVLEIGSAGLEVYWLKIGYPMIESSACGEKLISPLDDVIHGENSHSMFRPIITLHSKNNLQSLDGNP